MKRLAIESDPDPRASPLAASPVPQPGHRAFLSHNSADKAAWQSLHGAWRPPVSRAGSINGT